MDPNHNLHIIISDSFDNHIASNDNSNEGIGLNVTLDMNILYTIHSNSNSYVH